MLPCLCSGQQRVNFCSSKDPEVILHHLFAGSGERDSQVDRVPSSQVRVAEGGVGYHQFQGILCECIAYPVQFDINYI